MSTKTTDIKKTSPMTPLLYVKKEFGLSAKEVQSMDKELRDSLKADAIAEMEFIQEEKKGSSG